MSNIIESQVFSGELYIKASDHHRAVAAAVAAEREACARLCEQMFHDWCNQEFEDEDEAYKNKPDAEDCKKAIRARGQQ
jgi:hypothetical protein